MGLLSREQRSKQKGKAGNKKNVRKEIKQRRENNKVRMTKRKMTRR